MAYSRKASAPASESTVDWDGFNEHLAETIGAAESRVAVISGICDLGRQPRPNFKEAYDSTNEKHQKAIKEQGATVHDGDFYEKGKKVTGEYISIPMKPVDQVGIFASFPEVMINYGKFFDDSGEDRFEPYTNLIMGSWWDKTQGERGAMLAKGVSLSRTNKDGAWVYDTKNTISRLAKNCVGPSGDVLCVEKYVPQDFDIGEILGGICAYSLGAEYSESKGKKYLNINIKDCAKKHKMVPVPDVDVALFGVTYAGGNSDEDLARIVKYKPVMNVLELGEGWEKSGLKADLDAYFKKNKKESASQEEGSPKPQGTSTPAKLAEDEDGLGEDALFD